MVAEAVANEKGVPRAVIIEALEAALASAAKKRYPDEDVLVRVAINPKDGSYETFRRWEIIADDEVMESPSFQLRLMDSLDARADAAIGEFIEEQIENTDFGRISARPEEHTSELQSLMRTYDAVFCLQKKNLIQHYTIVI